MAVEAKGEVDVGPAASTVGEAPLPSSLPPLPGRLLSGHLEDLKRSIAHGLSSLVKMSAFEAEFSEDQRAHLASITFEIEKAGWRLAHLMGERGGAIPDPVVRPAENPSAIEGGELPTVLVVDDDLALLHALQDFLRHHFKVVIAADGLDALAIVHRTKPDLVLCDLCMPGAGALPLLELMRNDAETAQTPFFVLSGVGDTEAKIKAFEAGASDFLTKPVAPPELLARLKNAIARSRALTRERIVRETDELTGLANRRALRVFLSAALRQALEHHSQLTVLLVDQDGLKQVNDRYGHAAGDEALRTVSRALLSCKRVSDCAARFGGDEFVVVMPSTDRDGALKFIARVEAILAESPIAVGEGMKLSVSASFGMACHGDVAWEEGWEQIIQRADQALYEVKRSRHQQVKLSA